MGNKYQIVDCNECNQEFEIKSIEVRRLENTVEQNYFSCPHCEHEFTAFYTNTEIRNEQKNVQSLYSRFRNAKSEATKLKIEEKIKTSKAKLNALITVLRQTIESESK